MHTFFKQRAFHIKVRVVPMTSLTTANRVCEFFNVLYLVDVNVCLCQTIWENKRFFRNCHRTLLFQFHFKLTITLKWSRTSKNRTEATGNVPSRGEAAARLALCCVCPELNWARTDTWRTSHISSAHTQTIRACSLSTFITCSFLRFHVLCYIEI